MNVWPKVELHCHCGGNLRRAIAQSRAAAARGCDGLVFTEHNRVLSVADRAEIRAGLGKVKIWIDAGVEVHTREGFDVLCYGGLAAYGAFQRPEIARLCQKIKAFGGATILAHPWRTARKQRGGLLDWVGYPVDCVETDRKDMTPEDLWHWLRECQEYRVGLTAGSDSHRDRAPGTHATLLGISAPLTMWGVAEALTMRRTLPANWVGSLRREGD